MEGTESYLVAQKGPERSQDFDARLLSLGIFLAERGGGSSTSSGHLVATEHQREKSSGIRKELQ